MKISILILSISFFFVNTFAVLKYFSFNIDFYLDQKDISTSTDNIQNLNSLYDFFKNKTKLNNNFNSLESSHLQDVKNIFDTLDYMFWISIALLGATIILLIIKRRYNQILKGFFVGSILSLVFISLVFIFSLIDFRSSFDTFHKIFFPQGNRIFPENSTLITLFPESFFQAIAYKISSTIFGISLITIGLTLIIKKSPIGRFFI